MDCRDGLTQLPDHSIDTIITDTPFGIDHGKGTENYNRNDDNVIEGYKEIPIEEYPSFTESWVKLAYNKLTKYGTLIIVSSWSNQKDILNAISNNGFYLVNELIWKYNFGLFTSKKLVSSHYCIFICAKHRTRYIFNKLNWYCEDIIQSEDFDLEILDIKREYWRGKFKTPNKLPKELVEMLIFYYSNPDQIIVDLFSGSGTILRLIAHCKRAILSSCIESTQKHLSIVYGNGY